MNKINLSIFMSGVGTNFLGIHNASKNKNFPGKIRLVVCDKDCQAFHLSKKLKYETLIVKKNEYKFETIIQSHLKQNKIELICLAGFMTILSPNFVSEWKNKILNIHPSILPVYPGLNTHKKVLKSGMRFHGSTVHIVNENIDDGKILGQFTFPIEKNYKMEDLIDKIKKSENYFYPKVIKKYIWTYFKKQDSFKSDIFKKNNVTYSY